MIIHLLIFLLVFIFRHNQRLNKFEQSGGSRAAIFSHFRYKPQYPFISKLDTVDLNRFSKTYNHAGPLKVITGRPYRFETMPDGNWGYPWHFPEKKQNQCLNLASSMCNQVLNKESEILQLSKCSDHVYKQCSDGIDPLLILI
jgi:hypothetical protein